MKRNCLIALVSVCLVTLSAPRGLGKGLNVWNEPSQETRATVQTDTGAKDNKKQPQTDATSSSHTAKSPSPQTTTKEDRRAEQIKWRLRSLGIASRVTIFLNNGNERYGSIERLDDDTFQLAEVDMKQVFTMGYSEVKKVREGYGNPNQFTGKRWNPIWAKISVAAVIIMFAVIVPLSIPRT